MEVKAQSAYTKSIQGREVTGLFAVHGNIDDYHDISYPGSFTKTINERLPKGKIKFMWSHTVGDSWMGVPPEPPVAVVKSIQEIGRDALPADLLAGQPAATGAVEVVREYLQTPRGDEIFKAVASGAITEMSYGYDPITYDFGEVNGQQVRNLREVRLWEVSDVLWGANEATLASKWLPPTDVLLKHIELFLSEIKSGARHSSADSALINSIHKMALDLGATNCKGLVDEGSQDDGKSRIVAACKSARASLTKQLTMTPEVQAIVEAIDALLDTLLGEPEEGEPKSLLPAPLNTLALLEFLSAANVR